MSGAAQPQSGIIRVQHDTDHPYKVFNTSFATDARLSWAARGVLVYLLSKPDDWRLVVGDLIRQSSAGRDAVYGILKNLEDCGYLCRIKSRRPDGTFEQATVVYETAQPLPAFPDTANPDTDNPHQNPAFPLPAEPLPVSPYADNPDVYRVGKVPNGEKPIKERNDDDGGSSSSALLESIGGDDDGDDDGADGYDSVDALIDLEFTANQGTDAQAAYREADRRLDAAEVTRIAAWIAEPPPGIQNARGYLASKWKKGELVKMEHEKVKRGPVWDKEHHRFEPQPADLTPDVLEARDRLEAEIEATRGQLDPRVVDVRAAIDRFKLKPVPPAGTPEGFWRMAP